MSNEGDRKPEEETAEAAVETPAEAASGAAPGAEVIRPEIPVGHSRFDFLLRHGRRDVYPCCGSSASSCSTC